MNNRSAPYLEADWLGYRWTAWMPLMAAHPLALTQLPVQPGLYRVRRAGSRELIWIGWAEHGVRETVERLSRQSHLPVSPYDDPSAPAELLWRLRREERTSFEVSGTALSDTANGPECAVAAWNAYHSIL